MEESSQEIAQLSEIAEATDPVQEFDSEQRAESADPEPSSSHGITRIRLGPVHDQEDIVAEEDVEEGTDNAEASNKRYDDIMDDY